MEGVQFITAPGSGEQMQIVQAGSSASAGHQQIIQLPNGQQLVLPAGAQLAGSGAGTQSIQIQGQNGQLQQVQVVQPQSQGQQIVIQQPGGGLAGGGQVIQTADGQTVIYQPMQQQEGAGQVQTIQLGQGGQVIQLQAPGGLQGGNIIQVPTSQAGQAGGGVIMMVPGQNGVQTMQRIPLQDQELLDDQPLYVNAKQYHRILKRRQQRAKLEATGKIPKERKKYLHESRHKHAMARVRGDGGRFYSKEELKKIKQEQMERQELAIGLGAMGAVDTGDMKIPQQLDVVTSANMFAKSSSPITTTDFFQPTTNISIAPADTILLSSHT